MTDCSFYCYIREQHDEKLQPTERFPIVRGYLHGGGLSRLTGLAQLGGVIFIPCSYGRIFIPFSRDYIDFLSFENFRPLGFSIPSICNPLGYPNFENFKLQTNLQTPYGQFLGNPNTWRTRLEILL